MPSLHTDKKSFITYGFILKFTLHRAIFWVKEKYFKEFEKKFEGNSAESCGKLFQGSIACNYDLMVT